MRNRAVPQRRLRLPDFVLRCGADETGIHAVGDGVDRGMASAIAIKSDVCGWQLGIGRLDCKDDGVRSDWIGVDMVGIRAAQEQGARLECRFEFVETLLEFPLLLRFFAGLQETRAGCGRFFRAGLIVRASRDR
jgi:hypothetical protein